MKNNLILIICLFMVSCGTRKMQLEKTNHQVKVSKDREVLLRVNESTNTHIAVIETQQNDIQEQDSEVTITREYDLTPAGVPYLRSETQITRKGSKLDKSQFDKLGLSEIIGTSQINAKEIAHFDSLDVRKDKVKAVDANTTIVKNFGGWVALAVFIVLLIAGYWFVRNRN